MAVQDGYGKMAGTDALVFAYDTGDTRNSYKGEPTVNLVTPSGIDMTLLSTYTYLGRSQVSELSSPSSFACEMIVEDSQINTASRIQFGGAENIPTSGNTFISVSVKFQGGPTSNIIPKVFAGVGWTTLNPLDGGPQFITAEYRRFGALIQMGTSSGGPNPGFSMTQNNGNIQVGQKTRWHSPQVESKSHATPFINGTRSNTQGLLDLTGNSSINLSNVSFDSNAQITFDGTDDRLIVPHTAILDIPNNITVETVVIYQGQGGGGQPYSVITYKGYPWTWLIEDQNGIFNFRISTSSNTDSNISSGISHGLGNFHHVVATYDGVNQVIYVNGVLRGTKTLTGTINTSANTIRIGSYSDASYVHNGRIPIVKIYNRALTSTEVVNNYLKYKRQYGLT